MYNSSIEYYEETSINNELIIYLESEVMCPMCEEFHEKNFGSMCQYPIND